jgi:hypothetical protein
VGVDIFPGVGSGLLQMLTPYHNFVHFRGSEEKKIRPNKHLDFDFKLFFPNSCDFSKYFLDD